MSKFTKLPPDEVEKRRAASVKALQALERAAWEREYQKRCDTFFWRKGPCCAGCDHWSSEAGDIGECMDAAPVSGENVLKSLGIDWCSYLPPPGQPYTKRDHRCGSFQDTFDWSTLGEPYLKAIGAPAHLLTPESDNG